MQSLFILLSALNISGLHQEQVFMVLSIAGVIPGFVAASLQNLENLFLEVLPSLWVVALQLGSEYVQRVL
jgi:hypothetical protein